MIIAIISLREAVPDEPSFQADMTWHVSSSLQWTHPAARARLHQAWSPPPALPVPSHRGEEGGTTTHAPIQSVAEASGLVIQGGLTKKCRPAGRIGCGSGARATAPTPARPGRRSRSSLAIKTAGQIRTHNITLTAGRSGRQGTVGGTQACRQPWHRGSRDGRFDGSQYRTMN